MLCQEPKLRSHCELPRSRILDMTSHCRTSHRDRASSCEIAISTSDTVSEYLSVESDVCRYPSRPGSSRGDDVTEKGDVRRMGTSLAFWRPRSPYLNNIQPRLAFLTTSTSESDQGQLAYAKSILFKISIAVIVYILVWISLLHAP